MTLTQFRKMIESARDDGSLWNGVIGDGVMIPGLFGDVPLIYADYVASGRALRQVEDFIAAHVLPYYANSHTESSWCGAFTTRLREEARGEIARLMGAGENDAVIFTGSGATAGLNRLVSLLGVDRARDPVVLIGPYEHHSNILPWRESRARVIEIHEAPQGGPDLDALAAALAEHGGSDLLIGSFSAASNVSGIITDTDAVTRLLKAHGALAIWDYAGGGPYLPMQMGQGDARKDAIVTSPHKFPGGPGASGLLVVNRAAVRSTRPTWPGGGTVSFVSPWRHDYLDRLEDREDAGTPNVLGDIRAAMALIVKDVIGPETIAEREAAHDRTARAGWADHPRLQLLGTDRAHRLPIFSFIIRDGRGRAANEQLFTRMLSDIYGIQARGGCACAGPYGHRLLGIDRATSEGLRRQILAGDGRHKPGFVRLNFSYMMSPETAQYIVDSVRELAERVESLAPLYVLDGETGQYRPRARAA